MHQAYSQWYVFICDIFILFLIFSRWSHVELSIFSFTQTFITIFFTLFVISYPVSMMCLIHTFSFFHRIQEDCYCYYHWLPCHGYHWFRHQACPHPQYVLNFLFERFSWLSKIRSNLLIPFSCLFSNFYS